MGLRGNRRFFAVFTCHIVRTINPKGYIMLKNRALQVTMVNKKKDGMEAVSPEDEIVEKLAYVSLATKDIIKEGTKLIATYLVLDTARKIAIELATR